MITTRCRLLFSSASAASFSLSFFSTSSAFSRLNGLGNIFSGQGKWQEALRFYEEAAVIAEEIGAKKEQMEALKNMAEASRKLGRHEKAYEYLEKAEILEDTIFSEEKQRKIARIEREKALLVEKKEREKEAALAEEKSKRQRVVIIAVGCGLMLVLVFFFLLLNRFRITRIQKDIIEEQKRKVDEKHKDLTDSVEYAGLIQGAVLPATEEIKQLFPESFILFKPRDIVSGDFYFFTEVRGTKVVAACDCTGHGVPGAFMSMIGNTLLNDIINDRHVTDAASVLNRLRDGIINALKQKGSGQEQKDGMDIALFAFTPQPPKGGDHVHKAPASDNISQRDVIATLQYAGAYNPLYLIRRTDKSPLQGGKPPGREAWGVVSSGTNISNKNPQDLGAQTHELIEYKADKQPVGFHFTKQEPFTNHEIELEKGDTLYIFSDGYADQFGGPHHKKFMKKRFKELLISIQEKSMDEQKTIIDKTIEDWKGDKDQIDDICVIGVRV